MPNYEAPMDNKVDHVDGHAYTVEDGAEIRVTSGRVLTVWGPTTWLQHDGSGISQAHHRTEVFSEVETAALAHDNSLLIPNIRAEKKLLRTALQATIEDPAANSALAVHMMTESAARRFEQASFEQLGFKTAAELNGDIYTPGSNMRRVSDFIRDSQPGDSTYISILDLLRGEREAMTPNRIREVVGVFQSENRKVLDELYNKFSVDFSAARTYEASGEADSSYITRRTVYPIADSTLYFAETTLSQRDQPLSSAEHIPLRVDAFIVNGNPDIAYELTTEWHPAD